MKQNENFTFDHVAFRPLNTSTLAILAGIDGLYSSLVMIYDGTSFIRLPTSAYLNIRGIAWSPDASYALIAAQKGNDGAIVKYQGGTLTEVYFNSSRQYRGICWGDAGAYVSSYNFDTLDTYSVNIQLFDGTKFVKDLQVPGLNDVSAIDISWSTTLASGLCTAEYTNLLEFNSSAAVAVTHPSLKGNLADVAWAHSRPLAMITGADSTVAPETEGLLYSFNGTALTLESSGRYPGLNALAWHPNDRYALIAGDSGTLLRYTVPNNPPWCAITSPRLGEIVNGTVIISGTAWDPDSDPIVSVQVRIDSGIWQGATGGTEWNLSWNTTALANGAHTIYAKSNDGLDDSATVERMVIVDNPDRPPAVSMDRPSEGAAVSGTVTVSGNASDPDNGDSVTSVQLAIDDGQWANASGTSSWTYSWDTTPHQDGPHRIRARASDGDMDSAEAVRNVTVQNHGPNMVPSCTITSPTSGSLVSGEVNLQGAAADPENGLAAVFVRIDSGSWQQASGTSTWSFLWDTRPVAAGAHTLAARAFDGVQNSSDVRVTLQVGHPPVCSITSPAAGAVLTGEVSIQGTATDPDPADAIAHVKVRIDSGDWATATGTTSWTYRWNTSSQSSGQHVIRARCSDGTLESGEVSRTVTVEKPPVAVRLLEPTEAGEDFIILRWTANTDTDFARYEVFMSQTEGAPLSGLSPRPVPTQSVTTHNYTGLSARTTYWFRVRVVDTTGQSSVSNEVFATTTRANSPPVAMLTASRIKATVGGSITFSAQGSYDRDGRLARYQWDFEGKGRFPLDTGPIAEQRHEFGKAGKFLVQVKVTDDRGASSVASVEVTIVESSGDGIDPGLIFAVMAAVVLIAGALAFFFFRRPRPPQTFYEHEVHEPVLARRHEYWPDEEEQPRPAKKVAKKRRD
jgi:hypothetical protein